MYKVGFIGCGNMATAMMGGVIKAGLAQPGQVIAADPSATALQRARENLGIATAAANAEAADSEMLVLAVKPRFYEAVIKEVAAAVPAGSVVVSITPGKTLALLAQWFGRPVKLVRTMPNTPAMVGQGMTAACAAEGLDAADRARVEALLNSFGRMAWVEEYMIDAVTAVSGSSPAYVYMFIEALADGAVREGMPRELAYTFAAQAVAGSAAMVLESGRHPADLKDMVCSPGGSTIEAVAELERGGFRSAVLRAMRACAERSREL